MNRTQALISHTIYLIILLLLLSSLFSLIIHHQLLKFVLILNVKNVYFLMHLLFVCVGL